MCEPAVMDPVTHVWWLLPAPVLIAAAAPAALSDEKAESLHLVLQAKQRCNFRDKASKVKGGFKSTGRGRNNVEIKTYVSYTLRMVACDAR